VLNKHAPALLWCNSHWSWEIERAGAGSITDLLRAQPGVQINASGGAGTSSSVYLRGTNADHVVVLIDGLRINSATLGTNFFENIPLGQIERIEILRGPASSLYGADAIGGVIQIFTRKAEAGKTTDSCRSRARQLRH